MQISKVYRVRSQTWRDREYDTYDHQILFEGVYADKNYAEFVYNLRKEQLGSRMETGIDLEEINVVLNADGSYQEIKIVGGKGFLDTTHDPAYEKYRDNKIKEQALTKLTADERRVLGL